MVQVCMYESTPKNMVNYFLKKDSGSGILYYKQSLKSEYLIGFQIEMICSNRETSCSHNINE